MAYSYQGLYTNLYRNTLYLTKSIYTPPGKSQIVKGSGKSQVLNPLAICDFPGGRRGSGPTLSLGGRGLLPIYDTVRMCGPEEPPFSALPGIRYAPFF